LHCVYRTAAEVLFLCFFRFVLDDIIFREITQKEKKYARYDIDLTMSDVYFFMTSDFENYPKEVSKDFFQFSQNRYLSLLFHNPSQLRRTLPLIALYT
jgi:hypothetical protein